MPINLNIEVPDDADPTAYVSRALAAFGFHRAAPTHWVPTTLSTSPAQVADAIVTAVKQAEAEVEETPPATSVADAVVPKTRGRKAKAAPETRQISTAPESRVDPADEEALEDPPEVQAQDAADELAEATGVVEEAPQTTREDVKAALGRYAQTYGAVATLADIPTYLKPLLPENLRDTLVQDGKFMISQLPEDPGLMRMLAQSIDRLVKQNPAKRAPLATVGA